MKLPPDHDLVLQPFLAVAGILTPKVSADSNANALDSALDALCAFLAKADEDYAQRRAPATLCRVAFPASPLGDLQ